jgi:cation-transporting ATPase E
MNGAFSDTNATQKAVDEHFGRRTDWPVRETIPFSSARKYKAAGFESHGDYCIGAPEYLVPGNTKVLDLVADFSKKGYRVLLLGRSTGISAEAETVGEVTPVAVIVISDIIKEDARKTFEYFAKSGVDVKVLSGDNPVTVSTVSVKAGVK